MSPVAEKGDSTKPARPLVAEEGDSAWSPAGDTKSCSPPARRVGRAAWLAARRTAENREPGSTTRAMICQRANLPWRVEPKAASRPNGRARSSTAQTAPTDGLCRRATSSRRDHRLVRSFLCRSARSPERVAYGDRMAWISWGEQWDKWAIVRCRTLPSWR